MRRHDGQGGELQQEQQEEEQEEQVEEQEEEQEEQDGGAAAGAAAAAAAAAAAGAAGAAAGERRQGGGGGRGAAAAGWACCSLTDLCDEVLDGGVFGVADDLRLEDVHQVHVEEDLDPSLVVQTRLPGQIRLHHPQSEDIRAIMLEGSPYFPHGLLMHSSTRACKQRWERERSGSSKWPTCSLISETEQSCVLCARLLEHQRGSPKRLGQASARNSRNSAGGKAARRQGGRAAGRQGGRAAGGGEGVHLDRREDVAEDLPEDHVHVEVATFAWEKDRTSVERPRRGGKRQVKERQWQRFRPGVAAWSNPTAVLRGVPVGVPGAELKPFACWFGWAAILCRNDGLPGLGDRTLSARTL